MMKLKAACGESIQEISEDASTREASSHGLLHLSNHSCANRFLHDIRLPDHNGGPAMMILGSTMLRIECYYGDARSYCGRPCILPW